MFNRINMGGYGSGRRGGTMVKDRVESYRNLNLPQEKRRTWSLRNGGLGVHYRDLPKCQATAKSSGQRCKNIAMKGQRVCYLHGGKSTGAKTERGKLHSKFARLRHGDYSAKVKENRRLIRMVSHYYRLKGLL